MDLALLRALRPHQWVKNLLLFVPLALTPDRVGEPGAWATATWAFLAFCAAASAGYLMNDLADREVDRSHPTKRDRPLASGSLSPRSAVVAAGGLTGLALASCLALPLGFGIHLLLYLAGTLAYSFGVKRWLIVDVLMLAGFYVLRISAGGAAVSIAPTAWLMAFSLFLFLGLAFVKRYAELRWRVEGGGTRVAGRAYRSEDLDLVMMLGTTSSYLSVLVFCLYVNSDHVARQLARPELLWIQVPLLLYWVSRIWFIARRGELGGDPIVFAIRDRTSYLCGAAVLAVQAAASLA